MSKIKKVVLAYSGGLDTSAIVPWLKENYGCEVVAFVADVGQGEEELVGVEEKAIASGASECHIVDLKEEMVSDYIYPTLKTGAIYEGTYLLGTSMARPIIAKAQVEIARKVGADALSHGCTGKGNDQVRFESCFSALAPDLKVIAPWREWSLSSRESLLDYLAERNIPCAASATKIYSRDANAWHISHEGGELEDPWNEPSDQVWTMTNSPEAAPDQPEYVSVLIEKGEITGVNGERYSPYQCLVKLNEIAAQHGVGRVDIVENRLVGMKSRGCYETPGGTVMMAALQAIDELILDKSCRKWKTALSEEFAQLVYDGRWFTPLKDSILAAAESFAQQATGEVVLKLYKGHVHAVQKQSINSLYSEDFATFGEDDVYDQSHAEGFIRLFSLSSRIAALNKQKQS
ncbi:MULTISPECIES: argininosuccinate synthase [Pseudoalteromonas]|uniref:argininosuccinate synthase n=1 Tax=Pseudoalteromonas TaxID=53246 RepID=UPI000FFE628A|nr:MULTISPECIES: argininosuccinate synthase [Pseudoalteromonas]MCG9758679.1 argininosuccinate synthase [Pseudoalteromonas sp. Isolate6]NKC19956.1 argininosuccinate synthase [Pseudoalteromonas galatheae]RXE85688.1 argininosuccinate synthase [Pseudoalteromonas sp. A757]